MGFFFNESRGTKPPTSSRKQKHIPIETMRKMGCDVCSLNGKADQMRSPKMLPSGSPLPMFYFLGGQPSEDDDDEDLHFSDKAGAEIIRLFGKYDFERDVRCNHVVKCRGDFSQAEIECCSGHTVRDIEEHRPLVIVTVGDTALSWAAGRPGLSALRLRGQLLATRIGRHPCWIFPVITPLYVYKKERNNKGHELQLRADLKTIKTMVRDGLEPPTLPSGAWDDGVEIITGEEPGDMQRLERALDEISQLPNLAVDIETNGLRVRRLKEPGIATAAVGNFHRTVAFAIDHPQGWQTDGQRKKARALFGDWLRRTAAKTAHHLAMELEWFEYFYGEDLLRLTQWRDTLLMAHTLDPRPGTKSLDFQVRKYFGFWLKDVSANNIDVKQIYFQDLRRVLRYNGADAKWTSALDVVLEDLVQKHPGGPEKLDQKIRLAPVLVMAESYGLPRSHERAVELEKQFQADLQKVEGKLSRFREVIEYEKRFGRFEPTNSDHVFRLMRTICQRDEVVVKDKRSGTSKDTTGEEVLLQIPEHQVPSARLILEHRAYSKQLSTYVIPSIAGDIVDADGKLRTKYSQVTAITDRLSSEDTNLQNWSKRKFAYVRSIVAAQRGRIILACDYGQIEFRVVGMAAEDPEIVKAAWTGYDVHKFWAERIVDIYPEVKDQIVEEFSIDWDEKGLKTLRQEAKNKWVFPQLFGSSVASCAAQLKLPEWVAEDLAGEFWDTFRATKKWQEKLLQKYERDLYVETLGGHRRSGVMSANEIINLPIQGTAAEIVKEGMIAISERAYQMDAPDLHPILNVHDDLTYHPWEKNVERYIPIITEEMCKIRYPWINVPLVVEVSTGPNWHELKEVAKYSSTEIFNIRNPYV